MKYRKWVHAVTRKHLSDAAKQHPSAADEIEAWTRMVEAARWQNFLEVSSTFKDADNVDGYVVFIGGIGSGWSPSSIMQIQERKGTSTLGVF